MRTFEYMAFWDGDCGEWIAGATRYNQIGQGRTLPLAIASLKETIQICLTWARNEGIKDYFANDKGPIEEFTNTRGCVSIERGLIEPNKKLKYIGKLNVQLS